MARIRAFCHPMSPEWCWIKYQVNLRNIKYEAIAQKARRTTTLVSKVICGVKSSEKVESVLTKMLDNASWDQFWAAAEANAEKEAV